MPMDRNSLNLLCLWNGTHTRSAVSVHEQMQNLKKESRLRWTPNCRYINDDNGGGGGGGNDDTDHCFKWCAVSKRMQQHQPPSMAFLFLAKNNHNPATQLPSSSSPSSSSFYWYLLLSFIFSFIFRRKLSIGNHLSLSRPCACACAFPSFHHHIVLHTHT